jgi:hypothetical protein
LHFISSLPYQAKHSANEVQLIDLSDDAVAAAAAAAAPAAKGKGGKAKKEGERQRGFFVVSFFCVSCVFAHYARVCRRFCAFACSLIINKLQLARIRISHLLYTIATRSHSHLTLIIHNCTLAFAFHTYYTQLQLAHNARSAC